MKIAKKSKVKVAIEAEFEQLRKQVAELQAQVKTRNTADRVEELVDKVCAERYRWLRDRLQFELVCYNSLDYLCNAGKSLWRMQTMPHVKFEGTNKAPQSVDAAIDALSSVKLLAGGFMPEETK